MVAAMPRGVKHERESQGAAPDGRMVRWYLSDFGISAACGFGRRPGEEMDTTLATHRHDVDAFLDELTRA